MSTGPGRTRSARACDIGHQNQVIDDPVNSVVVAVECLRRSHKPTMARTCSASTVSDCTQRPRRKPFCTRRCGSFERCTTRHCKSGATPTRSAPSRSVRNRQMAQLQEVRFFTFRDAVKRNGVRLVSGGRRLSLHTAGNVRIRIHRPPMQGTLKQVSITLSGGHWYACMVCGEVPARPLLATGESVGVDVCITTFATLSTGEHIESPRPYRAAQRKLARLQRVVSRRKKRSARRRKAVQGLAGQHARVARVRCEFHHRTAKSLVKRFDSICVEDLNVKGLAARDAGQARSRRRVGPVHQFSQARLRAPAARSSRWTHEARVRGAVVAVRSCASRSPSASTGAPAAPSWSATTTLRSMYNGEDVAVGEGWAMASPKNREARSRA
jgi:hypothetical protein